MELQQQMPTVLSSSLISEGLGCIWEVTDGCRGNEALSVVGAIAVPDQNLLFLLYSRLYFSYTTHTMSA